MINLSSRNSPLQIPKNYKTTISNNNNIKEIEFKKENNINNNNNDILKTQEELFIPIERRKLIFRIFLISELFL